MSIVDDMRDWIADCSWNDLDQEEVKQLPVSEVVWGVAKHYDGGIHQFLRDADTSEEEIVALL